MTQAPDPSRYARAVLACVAAMEAVGLGDIATVHPDPAVVTDDDIGVLADRQANRNPWL